MNRPVIVRSSAEADIAAAAVWYENQAQGLGTRFLDAVQDAIHRATVLPRAHLLLRRKPEVRRVLTTGFPYRIFFIVEPDRLVVLRVLHGSRLEIGRASCRERVY
jgi:plasmid stabilization system protein ParE